MKNKRSTDPDRSTCGWSSACWNPMSAELQRGRGASWLACGRADWCQNGKNVPADLRGGGGIGISHDGGREADRDTVEAESVYLVLQWSLHLVDGGHPESQIQGQSWLSKYFLFVPKKHQISHVDSFGLRKKKAFMKVQFKKRHFKCKHLIAQPESVNVSSRLIPSFW